jgi:hypothetical protein
MSALAQSGHHGHADPCPLLGVKRTSHGHVPMSAFDPKRTSSAMRLGAREFGWIGRHTIRVAKPTTFSKLFRWR